MFELGPTRKAADWRSGMSTGCFPNFQIFFVCVFMDSGVNESHGVDMLYALGYSNM